MGYTIFRALVKLYPDICYL